MAGELTDAGAGGRGVAAPGAGAPGPAGGTPEPAAATAGAPEAAPHPWTADVVTVTGLAHAYGRTQALAGVDLTVAAGECLALLGPNGAGKTTLVNALTGLLHPDAGSVTVAGGDPRRADTRRRLGVVQQSVGFPRTLKVGELVSGWAVRYGKPASAADAVLEEIGIADLRQRRTHKLSGGQQQRLQLAMALVADPVLLILDEPTAGLDVTSRRAFWRILAARRAQGVAVLLTTHQIDEAAATADRVVVLHEGRVVASATPVELTARLPNRTVSARTTLDMPTLQGLPGVISATVDGGRVRLTSTRPEATVRRLLDADPHLHDLRVEAASLEEAVVAVTSDDDTPRDAGDHEEVPA